ncbi:MAG: acyl--CoA ligase [Novosphingobium sp.]|nr:acyl--CoA ligase [Novosphingobium sp.]
MADPQALFDAPFTPIDTFIRFWAAEQPGRPALTDGTRALTWGELDREIDRIAAGLQARGIGRGAVVAIAGANAAGYALALFATLRTGAAAALLTASASAEAVAAMLADSGATLLFLDRVMAVQLGGVALPANVLLVPYESVPQRIGEWLAPVGARSQPVAIQPGDPFNIIYSSGTTGTPKGIVQSHAMRMGHLRRAPASGFSPDATAIYGTPLYSNTTLVSFLAATAAGARIVLMPKFDTRRYLELAEAERATHTILVPVQYQRLLDLPEFDDFDLSAFRFKACTSAPFGAALKADILKRWPGRLVEYYGMTEGGGSCILRADEHPDKLHTVGQPAEGHDIRLIDEAGNEVPPGEIGEVVGRSETMMTGYHGLPDKTRQAEWYDPEGRRFIRHGDLARFDDDGFLILVGRAKDVIISGGFNVYPADLEAELLKDPAVADASVIGAPSAQWGETPVAFVVPSERTADLEAIRARANAALGKNQRIAAIHAVAELPRSTIGKVLKRELRDRLGAETAGQVDP